MLTLLFYSLTLISFNNHLLIPTQAKPKTTTNDHHDFTINLIHRYSPNSPFYNPSISLEERYHQLILASSSSHQHIKTLQNSELDTTIIPNGGDYLVKISVGTPPVELIAAASTGSDLIWFQCLPCDHCYQQRTTVFNPALSNTYKRLPCDSNSCSDLDSAHLICDQENNACRYWYAYGNASTITMGVMGMDKFSFNSSDGNMTSLSSPAFGCGYNQYGLFDGDSAGLLGLGGGPLSLVSQLGPNIGYKFSYCLAFPTSQYTSKLRFGGSQLVTGQVGVTTIPYFVKNNPSFYNLNLTGISIGGRSVQVEREIIIDIGTTLTYLDPSIYKSVEAMVNEVIGVKPMVKPLSQFMLCYDSREGTLTPPDIVFHFSGGDLVITANNVFFEYDGILCLSMVMSKEDGDPMVFGNMAQVNLEVEYDLLNRTVSFAQRDCAHECNVE